MSTKSTEALIQQKAEEIDQLIRELEERTDRSEKKVLSHYVKLITSLRDQIERLKSGLKPSKWL